MKFGTDGVRGPSEEFTDAFCFCLGRAAARVLGGPRMIIGTDTRASGPRIAAALAAGVAAEGVSPVGAGVVPTPAVAHASRTGNVPGAVVSASHNPFSDNGVKFFASGGAKLDDDTEARLEAELEAELEVASRTDEDSPAHSGELGVAGTALVAWEASVIASLEGRRLDGLHVVVDCANGAASAVAPEVLARLGATVTVLHAEPDGTNINAGCGSTHLGDLQREVPARGAALGLAFDGDADRVLAVDEAGTVVDGDQIIAMCALDLRDRGRLRHDTVVVTVMTNLGFHHAMAGHGVEVVQTAVGDRNVLEALAAGGFALGGEQSGHVIFADLATTGDGLLTGLAVADLVVRSGRPLSELAGVVRRLPQVLLNVEVARRDPAILDAVAADVAAAEQTLGDEGRVLLRPSGTEPLVRVMVEAPTEGRARAVADRLADAVRTASAG